MTEMVSFRSKISKRELEHRFGNVSEKINLLLRREMDAPAEPRRWSDALQPDNPTVSDKDYTRCLQSE